MPRLPNLALYRFIIVSVAIVETMMFAVITFTDTDTDTDTDTKAKVFYFVFFILLLQLDCHLCLKLSSRTAPNIW
ncbi:hypothetical protein M0N77_05315 [Psychrobacter sp. AH5]|uniref:hypothetical protein n=1 Tax=Psychrobacter sp. AH5 TaxID=2937433 RepID=UPI003340F89B